ncbi:MAG: histidinol-phosphate transaminase [Myxococcota bacterium]
MSVDPQPTLRRVEAYRVPGHPAPIHLDLSGNLGPQIDLELSLDRQDLRLYPNAKPLEALLSRRLGVSPAQLIVTAGADDAIDRICRSVLCEGRVAVVSDPGFIITADRANLCGAAVRAVPWPGGAFPVAETLEVGEAASLVVVTSPNNPTGAVATADDLRRLSVSLPDALLLVDLAYAEYADEDLTAAALALPNAVVTRTLSKAWGLAGLRVGFAVGPAPVIGWLRAAGMPYAVSQPSLRLAERWVRTGQALVDAHIAQVRKDRRRLIAVLAELGIAAVDSQANFVYFQAPDAAWLFDGLAGLGIKVRRFPGTAGIRIGCPATAEDLEQIVCGLQAVLAPEAVLTPEMLSAEESTVSALARLGVTRAWRVCQTAAQVNDARSAGVVPLGWRDDALLAAGAARIITDLSEVPR